MKTCGTCKHWGKDDDANETFRPCRAVIHDKSDLTGCYGDEFMTEEPYDDWERAKREEVVAIRKHKAVVKDGSGYFAALKVQSDFGCVLHEEKP